jgi:hypothetical protein
MCAEDVSIGLEWTRMKLDRQAEVDRQAENDAILRAVANMFVRRGEVPNDPGLLRYASATVPGFGYPPAVQSPERQPEESATEQTPESAETPDNTEKKTPDP